MSVFEMVVEPCYSFDVYAMRRIRAHEKAKEKRAKYFSEMEESGRAPTGEHGQIPPEPEPLSYDVELRSIEMGIGLTREDIEYIRSMKNGK